MKKEKFDKKDTDKVLMKDNSLVKAKYNLSLVQNKFFEVLLYNFQKSTNEVLSCEISRDVLKECSNRKEEKTVKGISNILESIRRKEILIAEKIEKENLKGPDKSKDKYKWHRYGLINGSTYNEDTDTFTIEATAKIYDLVKNYYTGGNGHTPINLFIKLTIDNYYAQRFYDLLRLWSNTKREIKYEVSELKELLQIEDKYPNYSDFKKRVIKPAIDALNRTPYFNITFKEKKDGRTTKYVIFNVEDLDKRDSYYSDPTVRKALEHTAKDNSDTYKTETEVITQEKTEVPAKTKGSKKTKESKQTKENKQTKEFYIPNKPLFTAKTLEYFERDFKDYDFTDSKLKNALASALFSSLDKDHVPKLYVKTYNYFKKTLEDQISKINTSEKRTSRNMNINLNSHHRKYGDEELETLLHENQKGKFK